MTLISLFLPKCSASHISLSRLLLLCSNDHHIHSFGWSHVSVAPIIPVCNAIAEPHAIGTHTIPWCDLMMSPTQLAIIGSLVRSEMHTLMCSEEERPEASWVVSKMVPQRIISLSFTPLLNHVCSACEGRRRSRSINKWVPLPVMLATATWTADGARNHRLCYHVRNNKRQILGKENSLFIFFRSGFFAFHALTFFFGLLILYFPLPFPQLKNVIVGLALSDVSQRMTALFFSSFLLFNWMLSVAPSHNCYFQPNHTETVNKRNKPRTVYYRGFLFLYALYPYLIYGLLMPLPSKITSSCTVNAHSVTFSSFSRTKEERKGMQFALAAMAMSACTTWFRCLDYSACDRHTLVPHVLSIIICSTCSRPPASADAYCT